MEIGNVFCGYGKASTPPPQRFEPRTVQHIASSYTDFDIPAFMHVLRSMFRMHSYMSDVVMYVNFSGLFISIFV